MVDNRGTILEVGQEVAYNLSGQIAKGRIVMVKPHKFGSASPVLEVELLHKAAGMNRGHVSKVRNEQSVLVFLGQEA